VLELRLADKWLIHWADPLGPRAAPPRRPLSPSELGRLFLVAEKHGVLAAVLKNAAATDSGDASEAILCEATACRDAATGFSLMLQQQADALMRRLGNLPAAIVKGPVFARHLYPEHRLRRFTDIDVLVADDAVAALDEPLFQLGFHLVEAQPEGEPQEWKWLHRDQNEMMIEVHRNLVHARSLRRAMSLTYRDIADEEVPGATELPASLLVIAGVHGATHNFERLLHVSDMLQAGRALRASDEGHLEQLIGRTGARFAVVAGLELAGRMFAEPRCLTLARALRPVRYVAGARWLLGGTVVVSSMDGRRPVHAWRRAIFRELLKRPQSVTAPGIAANMPARLTAEPAPGADTRSHFGQLLARHCHALGLQELDITVALRPRGPAEPRIAGIDREHNRISISCQEMPAAQPDELLHRLGAVLAVIGTVPARSIRTLADLSDGEDGGPGVLSFCSRSPDAILVPDHIFVRSRGYATYRQLGRSNKTAWEARSNWIIWRGLSTGAGVISKEALSPRDGDLLARVRLCLELRDVPETSAKLHAVAQSRNLPLDTARLASAGIIGDYISPIAWCGMKFAIDVDGNTNAWSNFFTRLLMGCCVLKVASAAGYRQWYYDDMEPWIHYVPVRADLADLRDRIAWCRANLAESRRIAATGQEFAMARNFDTEIAAAVLRVGEAHASGRLRAA
jgi:hypothetical protein